MTDMTDMDRYGQIWQIKLWEHASRGECVGSCQARWEKTSNSIYDCLQDFPKGSTWLKSWRWSPHCLCNQPWADWGSALEIIDCLSAHPTHSCVCMLECHDQMLGITLEVCFPLLCTDMPGTTVFRLYKLIEIRKNGESKQYKKLFSGGGGRERQGGRGEEGAGGRQEAKKQTNKSLKAYIILSLDTKKFALCSICFPSGLRYIIHQRLTLPCTCFTTPVWQNETVPGETIPPGQPFLQGGTALPGLDLALESLQLPLGRPNWQ